MANEIDRLEIVIEAQAKDANAQLDKLSQKLNTIATSLNGIQTGGLNRMANGVQSLSTAMSSMKGVKTSDFSRLARNLQALNSVETGRLYQIANVLRNMGNSLNGISGLATSTKELGEFARNVAKLGGTNVQNAITNIPNVVAGLNQLVTAVNGMPSVSSNAQQISTLITAVSRIGGVSVNRAITNLPLLATNLKAFMQTMSTAPNVSNRVVSMTNAVANLARQGNRLKSASNGITSVMNGIGKAGKKNTQSVNSFASKIAKLAAAYFLVKRAVTIFMKSITKSMDFIETSHYFDTVFEQVGKDALKKNKGAWKTEGYQDATTYVNSFAEKAKGLTTKLTGLEITDKGTLKEAFNSKGMRTKNLGLDPNEVMNYQAAFAQMTNAVGQTSASVMNMSEALTMLGADFASLANLDLNDMMQKLRSGLAGQTMPLRQFGIDVTNATLKMYALKYGIKDSLASMSQTAKQQLRFLAILDQSRVAFGNMANEINTPSNQLRLLKQNFSSLAQTIGNLFLPIVAKILPVINALVISTRRLFMWIGNLLGVDLSSLGSGGFGDATEGIDDYSDSIDDATDSAKKLKKALLSIDELNILSDGKEKDKNSEKDSGGYTQLDNAIAGALSEYQSIFNKALEEMDLKAEGIADHITGFFKKIAKAAEPSVKAAKNLWKAMAPFRTFIARGILDFYSEFLKPLGKYVLGENGLARVFNITSKLFREIKWSSLNKSLKSFWKALYKLGKFSVDTLVDFYEDFLAPIAKWTVGEGLDDFLKATTDFINGVNWETLRKSLRGIYGSLEKIAKFTFKGVLGFYKNFLLPVGKWVLSKDGIPRLVDVLVELVDGINFNALNKALENLWDALAHFGKNVGTGLINFVTGIAKVLKPAVSIAISGLAAALDALAGIAKNIPESVLKGIGYGIGVLCAKILLFNSATKVYGIIIKIKDALLGFKTMAAGNWINIAAFAIGTLVGALIEMNRAYSKEFPTEMQIYKEKINSLAEASDEFCESVDEVLKTLGKEKEALESEYGALETLADKYFELADKEKLSREEKYLLKEYSKELIKKIPELKDLIDKETGAYKGTKEEIQALIKKTKEYYLLEAAREDMIEIAKKQYEADKNLRKLRDEQADSTKKLADETEELKRINNELNGSWDLTGAWSKEKGAMRQRAKELEDSIRETKKGLKKLDVEIQNVEGSQRNLNRAWDEGQDYVAGLSSSLDKNRTEINEVFAGYAVLSTKGYTDAIKKQKEQTSVVVKDWAEKGIKNPFMRSLLINKNSAVFSTYGKNTVVGFNSGITNNRTTSDTEMTNWGKGIKGIFNNEVSRAVFKGYGGNVVTGFNSGISNNQNSTKTIFETWTGKIKEWFTAAFSIHSPSRLFKGYGKYTVEGFNMGISGNQNSTVDVFKKWVDGFQEVINKEDLQVNIKANYIDGKMNLGSTLGKVKNINTGSYTVSGEDVSKEITQSIINGIVPIMASSSAGRENINVEVPLYLDGEQLAKGVYRGQKKLDRRMNPVRVL